MNKYPEFIDPKVMMEELNLSKNAVFKSLKKMQKRDEVEFKIVPGTRLRAKWNTLYRMKGGN